MAYRPDLLEQDSATLGHGHVAHTVRGDRLVPVVNLLSLGVSVQLFAEFGVIGGDSTWLEHDQLKLKPVVPSGASNTVGAPITKEIDRKTTTIFFNGGSFTVKEVAAILINNGLKFKGHINASGCTVSNLQVRQELLLSRELSSCCFECQLKLCLLTTSWPCFCSIPMGIPCRILTFYRARIMP